MQFTNNLLGKNITFTGKQMASRNAVCILYPTALL